MHVEINSQFVEQNPQLKIGNGVILFTPPLDDEYWLFRVALSEKQAVVAFPKFTTFGIGFQYEEDWNTNLPYQSTAEYIFSHIRQNKADETISDDDCIKAIIMLQNAIIEIDK